MKLLPKVGREALTTCDSQTKTISPWGSLLNFYASATTDLSDLEWHTIASHEVTSRLVTSSTIGLSEPQAKRRLQEYGRNAPSPPKTNRALTIFGYFFKGFGGILLISSILVFISWKPLGEPNPAVANLVSRNFWPLVLTTPARMRSEQGRKCKSKVLFVLTNPHVLGSCYCPAGRVLHPGGFHHVPRLVHIPRYVLH